MDDFATKLGEKDHNADHEVAARKEALMLRRTVLYESAVPASVVPTWRSRADARCLKSTAMRRYLDQREPKDSPG